MSEGTQRERVLGGVFLLLLAGSLLPWVSAPVALLAGMAFALLFGNPFPAESAVWQKRLLQGSVVGLGAGMNLVTVAQVGANGFLQTLLGLSITLALAQLLAPLLRTERTIALLIAVGTAICGGSAIAAVAPAIGAKSHQSSVALAVVFLLNAVALLLFPGVGMWVGLSPEQFGLWSALAIHDTSSVVGASMLFGPAALAVGTTVKLARALWIVPLTFVLARSWKRDEQAEQKKSSPPWFILGFVLVAALVTFLPGLAEPGAWLAAASRRVLVATLFLVGAGISRAALKEVGVSPLLLGVVLWLLVATATLCAIQLGWLLVPPLS